MRENLDILIRFQIMCTIVLITTGQRFLINTNQLTDVGKFLSQSILTLKLIFKYDVAYGKISLNNSK